jgi:serine protease Do
MDALVPRSRFWLRADRFTDAVELAIGVLLAKIPRKEDLKMFRASLVIWMTILSPAFTQPPAADADRDASRRRRATPIVRLFNASKDAVVNISATQIVQVQGGGDDLDAIFRGGLFDFPMRMRPQTYKAQSVGSGFVIHPSGYIVTNNHVVSQTAERKAVFADNKEFDAEVIGVDVDNDLALLKVNSPTPLPVINVGRSDDVMVGETVVAIGNPLGLQHTVTSGIVSAVNRTLDINERTSLSGLIQTDASINPGNSGGPLFNIDGELIGINFAIRGDGQNIGFAIPVDRLSELLPIMLDVERRYRLNVGVELHPGKDAVVKALTPGQPGAAAGLQPGDRIATLDNQLIAKSVDFFIGLIDKRPGDRVPLTFARGGRAYKSELTLTAKPKPNGVLLAKQKLGIDVEEIEPEVAKRLGFKKPSGLFIPAVEEGGPAAEARIRGSDLLMQIERSQIASLDDLGLLLETIKPGSVVRVMILRFTNQGAYRITTRLKSR